MCIELFVVMCAPSVKPQLICGSWFRMFTLLCCISQNTK